jgi:hypothetical protein
VKVVSALGFCLKYCLVAALSENTVPGKVIKSAGTGARQSPHATRKFV